MDASAAGSTLSRGVRDLVACHACCAGCCSADSFQLVHRGTLHINRDNPLDTRACAERSLAESTTERGAPAALRRAAG